MNGRLCQGVITNFMALSVGLSVNTTHSLTDTAAHCGDLPSTLDGEELTVLAVQTMYDFCIILVSKEVFVLLHFRCGHCKKLAPEYEKAATALANADPPVPLAKVSKPS